MTNRSKYKEGVRLRQVKRNGLEKENHERTQEASNILLSLKPRVSEQIFLSIAYEQRV